MIDQTPLDPVEHSAAIRPDEARAALARIAAHVEEIRAALVELALALEESTARKAELVGTIRRLTAWLIEQRLSELAP